MVKGEDDAAIAATRAWVEEASRIVALTGYGQPEDISKAAAAGVDAHLVKPVDLDVLEAALAAPRRTKSPDNNVVSFERRKA